MEAGRDPVDALIAIIKAPDSPPELVRRAAADLLPYRYSKLAAETPPVVVGSDLDTAGASVLDTMLAGECSPDVALKLISALLGAAQLKRLTEQEPAAWRNPAYIVSTPGYMGRQVAAL